MSVITCRPIATGGSAETPVAGTGDRNQSWQIVTDNPADNEYTILASGLLPSHGSALADNPFSTLRKYSWSRDGKFSWVATAQYSTRPETQAEKDERDRQAQPNPLFRPAKIRVGFEQREQVIQKDLNGKSLLNKARELFSPVPTRPESIVHIAVTKNLPQIPTFFWTHKDRINLNPVVIRTELGPIPQTFPAKSLKFVPGDIGEVQTENGFRYVTCSWRFLYDDQQWQLRPLNCGFRQRVAGDLVICKDKNGLPLSEPALLDTDGKQIENPNADGSSAIYLAFDHIQPISFAGIPVS